MNVNSREWAAQRHVRADHGRHRRIAEADLDHVRHAGRGRRQRRRQQRQPLFWRRRGSSDGATVLGEAAFSRLFCCFGVGFRVRNGMLFLRGALPSDKPCFLALFFQASPTAYFCSLFFFLLDPYSRRLSDRSTQSRSQKRSGAAGRSSFVPVPVFAHRRMR